MAQPVTGPRALVDPELLPFLDIWPTTNFDVEDIPVIHEEFLRLLGRQELDLSGVRTTRATATSHDGHAVPLLVTVPEQRRAAGAVLWLHGGGYMIGTAKQDLPVLASLARDLGIVAVAVDYRLAPAHPHPAAVEDAYAGLAWLHAHAGELRVDTSRVVVAGESAGGGLAAGLALLARDRGELPVALQALVYPMLDDRTCVTDDPNPVAGEFMWTPHNNRVGWTALLGVEPGSPGVSPYAAPGRADDLAGLPPAYVDVGQLDLFVDEDIAYAVRLLRAGVPTELHVVPGAFHGYTGFEGTRVTAAFRERFRAAIRRVVAG